jgi:hypothetical protein
VPPANEELIPDAAMGKTHALHAVGAVKVTPIGSGEGMFPKLLVEKSYRYGIIQTINC